MPSISILSKRTRTIPHRRGRGSTLTETLIAVFIFSLMLTSLIAGLRAMAIGADQQVTESGMGFEARRGVDEMLSHMRYASGVVASYTSATKTYTTSNSTIVMTAAGYDPATTDILLPGITDYMIFEYDATNKEIRETLIPGAGSKRVARTNYLLAKNVASMAFTYRARNRFNQPDPSHVHTLSTNALSAPTVTVNGEASTGIWTSGLPNLVEVNASSGSEVQFFYPVSSADTTALGFVQQVDVAVNFSDTDSKNKVRTLAMSGSACLRNRRVL